MNAYQLKCLRDMGIVPGQLGAVMLDVEPVDVSHILEPGWDFITADPALPYITKFQQEGGPAHITLKYGLLKPAYAIRWAIDEVLDGWEWGEVTANGATLFPGARRDADTGEGYKTLVLRIARTPELMDGNARLSFLPHIDTFPEYKPHLTLAYLKEEFADEALARVRSELFEDPGFPSLELKPVELNYGDPNES